MKEPTMEEKVDRAEVDKHLVDVYDLLEQFTDNNVKHIVLWVQERKLNRLGSPEERAIYHGLESLRTCIRDHRIQRGLFKSPWKKIRSIYEEQLAPYEDSQALHSDMRWAISGRNLITLEEAIYTTESRLPKGLWRYTDTEAAQTAQMDTYLRDPELLMREVLELLSKDYEERMTKAKLSILRYVEPHHKAIQRLNKDLTQVREGLERLEADSSLLDLDRAEIKRALTEKYEALYAIRKEELGKMRNLKAFVQELKTAQEHYRRVLTELEHKSAAARARKDYLALITSVNAKVPEFQDLFAELSQAFSKEMADIKQSFQVLTLSVQEDLLEALDRQTQLSAILGTAGPGDAQRLVSKTGTSQREENSPKEEGFYKEDSFEEDPYQELDLSFL